MHRITRMKDRLIEEAQSRMENLDGGSIEQMGRIIDMIKDLAETEKACMEADYYDSVVEAMDGDDRYGYDPQGSRSSVGRPGGGRRYEAMDDGDRMGYKNQYGNWPANPANRRRRMRRRGYSEESVENLRQLMEEADPERKRQLKQDLEELMQEL